MSDICEELTAARAVLEAEKIAADDLYTAANQLLAEAGTDPDKMMAAMILISAAMQLQAAAALNLLYNYWNLVANGCVSDPMMGPAMAVAAGPALGLNWSKLPLPAGAMDKLAKVFPRIKG